MLLVIAGPSAVAGRRSPRRPPTTAADATDRLDSPTDNQPTKESSPWHPRPVTATPPRRPAGAGRRPVGRRARSSRAVVGAGRRPVAAAVPTALAAPAGAEAKRPRSRHPHAQGLRPQAGQDPDRAGPVQRGQQERRRGLRGRAAHQDLSHILGEQENLTPGLSGGFSLDVQPGQLHDQLPGRRPAARHLHRHRQGQARLAVQPAARPRRSPATPATSTRTWPACPPTQAFCAAIDAGNLTQAKLLYPKARVYYERIEPVAEVWGTLDTDIDGRIDNPVTVPAEFKGFHKIESSVGGRHPDRRRAVLLASWSANEQQLLTLVATATYNPLDMASGATDLINEAATAKITGEEERYSNTDLPVFQANVDGAMEVVSLLQPYLQKKTPPADPDHEQRRRRRVGHRQVPGHPGLRRHRLRRVLHRPRPPAPPALGRGERVRRGPVQDVGQVT